MKKIILLSVCAIALTLSCKKSTTAPAAAAPTPTPVAPAYSTFSSTIAVVDYTTPTGAWASYSVNLAPTTTAMAYIVADNIKIDSLPLTITRVADGPQSFSVTPCDSPYWNSYSLNSKDFKVKNGSINSLCIYENGTLVSSTQITISGTYVSYSSTGAGQYDASTPLTTGWHCADLQRYRVIQ